MEAGERQIGQAIHDETFEKNGPSGSTGIREMVTITNRLGYDPWQARRTRTARRSEVALMTLNEFKEKLNEYATNNITALMGQIQITSNERADLRLMYQQLAPADRPAAEKLLKAKGVSLTE